MYFHVHDFKIIVPFKLIATLATLALRPADARVTKLFDLFAEQELRTTFLLFLPVDKY